MPWAGRVGSDGVVGLVVAVLRVYSVAGTVAIAVVVVSIGMAATAAVVAHSLLRSVGVGLGTTVAVVAARHGSAALRVAVGLMAYRRHIVGN